MRKKIPQQYGLWKSPITPLSMSRLLTISDVGWDMDGTLVWRENRLERSVLVVQLPDGQAFRDLNSDYSVRAKVGYGGGDFTVGHGYVYFVEAESGRLYRQATQAGVAESVTPAFGYTASPAISPDGRYLLFVHTYERKDSIGIVDSEGKFWPQKLVSGDDFYMQPCWHPEGQFIAWISWNHPQMPWDGTRLHLAEVLSPASGENLPTLGNITTVAGDEKTSILQPAFSPDGHYLAYISDESGWWHLYLYDLKKGDTRRLTQGEAEHGVPAWVQGRRVYGFSPGGESIFFIRNHNGFCSLWQVDIGSGHATERSVGDEYTWLTQIAVSPKSNCVALIASGAHTPDRVITHDLSKGTRVWRRSCAEDLPPQTYSVPLSLTWKGMDGGTVYGVYYRPSSETFEGLGLPPLMVLIHGGPTSQRGAHFDEQAQFFASRGYAVLQVNYRGSTGYGRAYRDMLKGNWGITDVQDAVSGARDLVEQGLVDGSKLVIMGGSAGGFTVLKALEDYPGFFKAGVCLYGVANQFTLVADTHKFEERYSDSLLGPLPEAADVYRQRSPIFFAENIQDPVAIFQGEDDRVVPRDQSDEIVAVLERRGVPHEYHLYPGEGHGFSRAETIEKFYTAVEKFLRRYVIFA
ncbi:MAG: S9 family peptidase [Chloroflexota bacterium]